MIFRFAFLIVIGLIASCAGEENSSGVDAEKPSESVVPAVEISNAPAAVDAAPVVDTPPKAPAKTCQRIGNKNKRIQNDNAVSCRGGEKGAFKCKEICRSFGFKLASCRTSSYKPRQANASCVCSNDGKLGVVATEYEGPPSLRRIPGYYKKHFPLKLACNDCACNKLCEAYRMSPDDRVFTPYTKGACLDRSCVCLKAFHADYEEKLAKRFAKRRPQQKI